MFIDTHCHLDEETDESLVKIIKQMNENKMIASGCNPSTNKRVIELINQYDTIYGTIGIHPGEIENITEEDFEFLEKNINHPKIVGIGEIGLDYYYGKENKEKQKEFFQRQIKLAKKYNKTIVIHSRDAAKDTVDLLIENNLQNHKIVMHCFSYSLETAKILSKMNVMFGIGGVVTFKNAHRLKEVVENIPLQKLLLETDSPYLAPEPFRGKTNYPYHSLLVAEKIAELKQTSLEEVLSTTTQNAISQFDLKI